ncbi:MAG: hypothetical protein AABW85_01310 [archaeon]
MALMRRRASQFRGPTPSKVFQTVDIGSGRADYIRRQAGKFPQRRYAAIDPLYKPPKRIIDFTNPVTSALQKARIEMDALGVTVHAGTLSSFIGKMLRNRHKTRYFNVDMPNQFFSPKTSEFLGIKKYGFEKLFMEAPNILLPKGQIFFSTESNRFLVELQGLAKQYGLRFRRLPPITKQQAKRTTQMKSIGTIQRATIIFEPRKYRQPKQPRRR